MGLDETSVSRSDERRVSTLLVEALEVERLRREDLFAQLVRTAADIAEVPVAVVALVDDSSVHTISAVGVEARSRSRSQVLGGRVVDSGHALVFEDVHSDPRLEGAAPAVDGRPVRFYFGQPLTIDNSISVGTLSVIDFDPRRLSVDKRGKLSRIARQVELQLEYIVRQDGALDQSGLAAQFAVNQQVNVRRQALTNFLLHEVINAATAAKADADFVRARARSSPQLRDALDDIAEAADAMAERLHSAREILLEPNAIFSGLEPQVDLDEVLDRLQQIHRPELLRSKRALRIEKGCEDCRVTGEPRLIAEIFEGLLGASFAAAPPGTDIVIELLERDEQTIEIRYSDQGEPMSDKFESRLPRASGDMEAVADAEFDAQVARDSIAALSLCSMIVAAHGGEMRAACSPSGGRTFRIHLPR